MSTMKTNSTVTFERIWNDNEYTREGRNGRLYTGVLGWRWYPLIDGKICESLADGYKTKMEAQQAALRIQPPKSRR